MKRVTTNEVWQWPEFKAFTKRLGINAENTIELRIVFPGPDGMVTVEQEFMGVDRGPSDT